MVDEKNMADEELEEETLEEAGQEVEEKEEAREEVLEEGAEEPREEELKNQLMRLQADFQNFRRRSEEDKSRMMSYAVERFVLDLLPIVDNFERALESEEDREGSFYQGISLIYDSMKKTLEKNDIEEMQALHEEFDPNLHHAVFMEETDEFDEGLVTEVLQKGYVMKDKVIRPAMVKVSK